MNSVDILTQHLRCMGEFLIGVGGIGVGERLRGCELDSMYEVEERFKRLCVVCRRCSRAVQLSKTSIVLVKKKREGGREWEAR